MFNFRTDLHLAPMSTSLSAVLKDFFSFHISSNICISHTSQRWYCLWKDKFMESSCLHFIYVSASLVTFEAIPGIWQAFYKIICAT